MPQDIFSLCDALVEETAALSPVLATMVGVRGYDHLWDDFSTAGQEHAREALESQLGRVRAADTGGEPDGMLAAEVVGVVGAGGRPGEAQGSGSGLPPTAGAGGAVRCA